MAEILETNVKIDADASKLKSEVDDSTERLKKLKAELEEIRTQRDVFSHLNVSSKVVDNLTARFEALQETINGIESGAVINDNISDAIVQDVEETQARLDSTPLEVSVKESGLSSVQSKLKNIQSKIDDIKKEWSTAFNDSGATKNLKTIALSLMGIRSVFTGIRKAMSTYLAQNEELNNKINGIWYALGSLLAPIVEWMVNLFAKIVLYVNAFLKGLGLAGIDMTNLNKSATKLKKLISGFDELNIYSSSTSSDTATNPFEDVEVNTEWIEKLTKLGEKLKPVFEWLKETLTNIFDWCSEHIELILALLAGIGIAKIIAKIVEVWGSLKKVWEVVKSVFELITTSTIATTIGGWVNIIGGVILAVSEFVDMWKNGWNIIGEILKDIGIALAAIGAVILGAPATVAAVVAGIVAVVSSLAVVIHEHWDEICAWTKEAWEKIKEVLANVWEAIKTKCEEVWNSIVDFFKETWTNLKNTCEKIFTELGEWLESFWTNLKQIVSNIVSALKEKIEEIWNALSTATKNIFTGIYNTLSTIWNNLTNFISNAVTKISNGVVAGFTAMKNAISNIFNALINVIKVPVNAIIGVINGLVSGITKGINAVIKVLNKFSIDIPDWVPLIGGKHLGFNLTEITAPQIPYLANGGVINKPTVAMLGEYQNAKSNPEIAAPQSVIKDMLTENNGELVNSFAQMTQQIISAINNVDMEVSIGDDTIAKSAQRGNRTYYNMTGKSMFAV